MKIFQFTRQSKGVVNKIPLICETHAQSKSSIIAIEFVTNSPLNHLSPVILKTNCRGKFLLIHQKREVHASSAKKER